MTIPKIIKPVPSQRKELNFSFKINFDATAINIQCILSAEKAKLRSAFESTSTQIHKDIRLKTKPNKSQGLNNS